MMIVNNPFSSKNIIWYVSEVSAPEIKVHFPDSKYLHRFYNHWKDYNGWIVWSYVVIEWETKWFLWKFVKVTLPEKERKMLTEEKYKNSDFQPIWYIELLFSFDLLSYKPEKSINNFPSVWAKVYVTNSDLYIWLLNKDKDKFENDKLRIWEDLDTGSLVEISANKIFQRHCAIVWTTWWWKSYTVSKIIEELILNWWSKVLLLDPTWEYSNFKTSMSYKFNKNIDDKINEDICFHYKNLDFDDLLGFFRPWWQIQLPLLEEALKVLSSIDDFEKIPSYKSSLIQVWEDKLFKKSLNIKKDFNEIIWKAKIWNYNIKLLWKQLYLSSVYENKRYWDKEIKPKWDWVIDEKHFWDIDGSWVWNLQSIIYRINSLMNSDEANQIYNFDNKEVSCITKKIDDFIWNDKENLFKVDLSQIPEDKKMKELTINAIWKYLLKKAKERKIWEVPFIVFIDEAHLFLNRTIKDEHSIEVELNAFEKIAKECRKYWLFLCIATQRPRDIPEWILSQMWTFIVHRLINGKDKWAIENSVSNYNKSFLNFLPSLWQWEALVMGVDFLTTLFLKIKETNTPPNSETPEIKFNNK